MRYLALVMMCTMIITSFSGCEYIDGKQELLEQIAKQKQLEIEALARRKADAIKQDIQDRIDNKIDELAGDVKDNLNIMGEGAMSGDDAESNDMPENGVEMIVNDGIDTDVDGSGIELGALPVS